MPRFAANLSFLFTELPFLDRFEAAAAAGFRAVEFLFPYATPAAEIRARLDATGLEVALFNLPPGHWDKGERGYTAIPGRDDEVMQGAHLALTYATALGCRRLHALAGLVTHGADRRAYVANLGRICGWAADEGVTILVEPINTRDMPGYFLTRTADARDIIGEVGAPNLALQFDLYHRAMMEGGTLEAIAEFAPIVAHYQIAAPPDRGEPDAGDLDFRALFAAIDATGYGGFVGCEYRPRAGTLAGLAWARTLGVDLG